MQYLIQSPRFVKSKINYDELNETFEDLNKINEQKESGKISADDATRSIRTILDNTIEKIKNINKEILEKIKKIFDKLLEEIRKAWNVTFNKKVDISSENEKYLPKSYNPKSINH